MKLMVNIVFIDKNYPLILMNHSQWIIDGRYIVSE